MTETRPETVLEAAIRAGKAGTGSADDVLWALAASEVVVLTPSDPAPSADSLAPLVVHRGDSTFVAIFSHVDQVAADLAGGRSPVAMPAAVLLRGIDSRVGAVVNPGRATGFEVPAAGLAAFRAVAWPAPSPSRYFVRQLDRDGQRVPFALLRRTIVDDRPIDEVLRDVGQWSPDRNGSVDKAIRMPLETDLEEITPAQADEVESMVARRTYRPLADR